MGLSRCGSQARVHGVGWQLAITRVFRPSSGDVHPDILPMRKEQRPANAAMLKADENTNTPAP
jgi:hypothetical protein